MFIIVEVFFKEIEVIRLFAMKIALFIMTLRVRRLQKYLSIKEPDFSASGVGILYGYKYLWKLSYQKIPR